MWFCVPQLRGLGRSSMATFYGIASLHEARTYLAHSILGPRLELCTRTVLELEKASLHDIFGSPDDMKFQSCMTLFAVGGGRSGPASSIGRWIGGAAAPSSTHAEPSGDGWSVLMCNDFGNPRSVQRLSGSFSQIKAPVVFPTAAPNVEPREDIWPTDPAVVVRRRDEGVELVQLRWGSRRPKGAPVINFWSEEDIFPSAAACFEAARCCSVLIKIRG